MNVTITNFNPERKVQLIEAANQEWSFDDWYQEANYISACAEDNLCGGEGEEEFATRLTKAIWKANGAFCGVDVQATYLEDRPSESYSLTEEDYNKMGIDRDYDRLREYEDDETDNYTKPCWEDAEPANEVQAKAWGDIINSIYDDMKVKTINLPAAIAIVCQNVQVRPENYASLSLQVERFIRESSNYELRKGKNGGVFRKELAAIRDNPITYTKLIEMAGVPDMITGKLEDNYTCHCGNNKCNKTEKSCWKCGSAIKP
jgi:hypothetical protein